MEYKLWYAVSKLGKFPYCILWLLLVGGVLIGQPRLLQIMGVGALGAMFIVNYILGGITKLLYYKPRPQPLPYHNRYTRIHASSFPSVHTAHATSVLIAWLCLVYYVGATTLMLVSLAIVALITTAIGLSRIVLQRHFPIDVLGGVVYGIISAGLVYGGWEIFYTILYF